MREVAKLLVRSAEAPRIIISSPLVRALQTAEISRQRRRRSRRDVARPRARGDAFAFARALANEDKKRAMIVGHEPDLSTLVATFLGGSFAYDMLKAMVVGLQVRTDEDPALRFVLDPKALRLERGNLA